MFNLNDVVKFDKNGNVDVTASTEAFTAALTEYAALQAADMESCGKAVDQVWADNPALSVLPLDNLASIAAMKLTQNPAEIGIYTERCKEFVRHSPKYSIVKGRNGGVRKATTPES